MGVGEDIRAMLDGLERHDAVSLSPVERLLLATDGTVTHALEALTREAVEVDIIDRDIEGTDLTRKVALRRSTDGSALAWARAEVDTASLPPGPADRLVSGEVGIGHLLREEYAETRREIQHMEPVWTDNEAMPRFITGGSVLYLARTYTIHTDETEVMSITEWFPKGLY